MYSVQELYLRLLSCSAEVFLASFTSSTVSVHSSINLSTNSFLLLQFSWSKYSQKSHDLSHSHSELLEFQIDIYHIHLYQLILYLCILTFIHHHSNVVYYCKHFHQIYIYSYTFHTILYVLFHWFLTLD